MSTRALCIFLGSLLLASWGIQAAALALNSDVNSPTMTYYLVALMFQPTLWTLVYLRFVDRSAWQKVLWRLRGIVPMLLGALLPAVFAFTLLAVVLNLDWGSSKFFSFSGGHARVDSGPWLLGRGAQAWPLLLLNVGLTAIAFAVMNGVVALGEEFGWRAFLQQQLIDRYGLARGVAVLGLAWAFWHLPMNLAGYNHPETPLLGALVLFPLKLLAESFIMAWLVLKARSFWPAVLMHGSANGIGEGMLMSMTRAEDVSALAIDVVTIVIVAVVAVLLWLGSARWRAELARRAGTAVG